MAVKKNNRQTLAGRKATQLIIDFEKRVEAIAPDTPIREVLNLPRIISQIEVASELAILQQDVASFVRCKQLQLQYLHSETIDDLSKISADDLMKILEDDIDDDLSNNED